MNIVTNKMEENAQARQQKQGAGVAVETKEGGAVEAAALHAQVLNRGKMWVDMVEESDELYVKVRREEGEVIVHISDLTDSVYKTIAAALELTADDKLTVLHGGERVEFGTSFEDNSIEHKGTLSALVEKPPPLYGYHSLRYRFGKQVTYRRADNGKPVHVDMVSHKPPDDQPDFHLVCEVTEFISKPDMVMYKCEPERRHSTERLTIDSMKREEQLTRLHRERHFRERTEQYKIKSRSDRNECLSKAIKGSSKRRSAGSRRRC
jgi:hypothetical protein